MKGQRFGLPIVLLGGLFVCQPVAEGITVSSASPGYLSDSAIPGLPGLAGEFWDLAVVAVPVDGLALAQGGWAETNVYNTAPTGTFTFSATTDYIGNDLTAVSNAAGTWLGVDAATYSGTAGDLDDGIIQLLGYVNIEVPNTTVTLTLNTDDGSRLFIAGQESIANDGSHGDVTVTDVITFVDPGFYPIDVRYFNGDWTSDGNNHSGNPDPAVHGGANFRFSTGGLQFVQSVIPEPTVPSLIAAFAGLSAIVRRRRK